MNYIIKKMPSPLAECINWQFGGTQISYERAKTRLTK